MHIVSKERTSKAELTMVADPSRFGLHCPSQMSSIPHHSLAVEVQTDIEFGDHTRNRVVCSPEHTSCVWYNNLAERMLAVVQWCTYCLYVLSLILKLVQCPKLFFSRAYHDLSV